MRIADKARTAPVLCLPCVGCCYTATVGYGIWVAARLAQKQALGCSAFVTASRCAGILPAVQRRGMAGLKCCTGMVVQPRRTAQA